MDDIEAIKRVQGQYGRAADTKNWDLLRPTVTDDFHCDTGAGGRGVTTGIDAFIARVGTNPAVTVHHALLPEIELTSPTTATGVWAVHLFGHYHNTYQKHAGAWRLGSLRLEWLHREVRPGQPAQGHAA
jgi:hypothetical protein